MYEVNASISWRRQLILVDIYTGVTNIRPHKSEENDEGKYEIVDQTRLNHFKLFEGASSAENCHRFHGEACHRNVVILLLLKVRMIIYLLFPNGYCGENVIDQCG